MTAIVCRIVLLLMCGVLGCMPASSFAQFRNVKVASADEPAIVIDPNNTHHLLAGVNVAGFHYSTNGGASWRSGSLSSPYGVMGDPCVVVDTNSHFYFFHLSNPPNGTGSWIDRIVCQKLGTLGGAWSSGTYMGLNGAKAQDKEWAVVDRANNRIYVTWTQFDSYGSADPGHISIIRFSASTNGGQTWSEPIRINEVVGDCRDGSETVEGAVPAVGPAGEIYVAWSGPAGIVFDRSLDGGQTWLDEDIRVSDQPGGWDYSIPGINRANGLPVTACDVSRSACRGNIYINWSDQPYGPGDTDIWLARSTDRGLTWGPPKRVNDDPPGRHQFFTWMTIDQSDGTIYIVFYDRRNYDDMRTDVYLATSRDGGETFVNTRISQSPFTPSASRFFGDYSNISAHNGVVRPIWARADGTVLSTMTAIINPPPRFSEVAISNGAIHLAITNLTSYLTNFVERSLDLSSPGPWTTVDTFTGREGATNWTESLGAGWIKAYYRIRIY